MLTRYIHVRTSASPRNEPKPVHSLSNSVHRTFVLLYQLRKLPFFVAVVHLTAFYNPLDTAGPFFHSHRANEENYIILSGAGRFQVNDEVFDIAEGSVIRVTPGCDRNLKCTSTEPMTYICIQAREGSLGDYTMTDADMTERRSLL